MTRIESAIASLQREVDAFGQGTAKQPSEGSADWFLLRAKSLGLSYLRSIRAQNLGDERQAGEAEQVYRAGMEKLKEGGE